MHGEGADAVLPQDLLLSPVDIAQADIDELGQRQLVLVADPAKQVVAVALGQPGDKGQRHAVDVAALAGLGRVDVGVRIHPDDGRLALAAGAVAHARHRAGNAAHRDAVVAAQRQRKPARRRVRPHLARQRSRHRRHGARVVHAAVRHRVRRRVRQHRGVIVHYRAGGRVGGRRRVVDERVAELVGQLGQQAGVDECLGSRVGAGLALELFFYVSHQPVGRRWENEQIPVRRKSRRRQRPARRAA